MPVEIRELVIRATLVNPPTEEDNLSTEPVSNESHHDVVAACVAQVLKILERKRER